MGPDLIGMLGAVAFLSAVIACFALLNRLLSGAVSALAGSPGRGLVAGLTAWGADAARDAERRPGSPAAADPRDGPPDGVAAVGTERLSRMQVAVWSDPTAHFAAA